MAFEYTCESASLSVRQLGDLVDAAQEAICAHNVHFPDVDPDEANLFRPHAREQSEQFRRAFVVWHEFLRYEVGEATAALPLLIAARALASPPDSEDFFEPARATRADVHAFVDSCSSLFRTPEKLPEVELRAVQLLVGLSRDLDRDGAVGETESLTMRVLDTMWWWTLWVEDVGARMRREFEEPTYRNWATEHADLRGVVAEAVAIPTSPDARSALVQLVSKATAPPGVALRVRSGLMHISDGELAYVTSCEANLRAAISHHVSNEAYVTDFERDALFSAFNQIEEFIVEPERVAEVARHSLVHSLAVIVAFDSVVTPKGVRSWASRFVHLQYDCTDVFGAGMDDRMLSRVPDARLRFEVESGFAFEDCGAVSPRIFQMDTSWVVWTGRAFEAACDVFEAIFKWMAAADLPEVAKRTELDFRLVTRGAQRSVAPSTALLEL